MTISFHAKHKNGFYLQPLEQFTFPAGEAHIKGFDKLVLGDYEYFFADVRGHSPQDLFHLALWANGLREKRIEEDTASGKHGPMPVYHVLMPYLPAARSDRGVPVGAFTYAEFLNQCVMPNSIIAVDPHSDYMPSMLNGHYDILKVFPFERIIKNEIQNVESDEMARPYVGVIAPDAGAVDRATRAARLMGVPVYRAGKTRDFETGKLTGFHMEDELPAEGKLLIVDDICDGGGTFVGLADAIGLDNTRLDLWVTHGVFSKGVEDLGRHFGTIHTTDSYLNLSKTFMPPYVKVHPLQSYLYGELHV
jgi:ribose-phosphate pyrophosphokinase